MRRALWSLAILLMASTVLADEPFIQLGDPEGLSEEPSRLSAIAARPIQEEKPSVNFGFDEKTGRMKHSHRCEGCQMKKEEKGGWHFHHCADPRCKVKIPENLELCPDCGWSFCQCQFKRAPQIAPRVRQTQFDVRAQNPPLEPIPNGQLSDLPPQGFSGPYTLPPATQYGHQGGGMAPQRGTIASGGVNALGIAAGAGVTYPKRGWWCGCAPKPLLGGNLRVGHLRFGTGFDWVP